MYGRLILFFAVLVLSSWLLSCGYRIQLDKDTRGPEQTDTMSSQIDDVTCREKFRQFAYGTITISGLINCFEAGLKYPHGKPVYCETSAAVFDGKELFLATDQPVPGTHRSPVFVADLENAVGMPKYITEPPLQVATKYEDAGLTPDGQFVFLTTGFDRVKADSAEWDPFNTILFWPVGNTAEVGVVGPSEREGIVSSVGLRTIFSRALRTAEFPDGVPYFKIEGLALLPGNQMLLGVRESGLDYRNFRYVFQVLSVSYSFRENRCVLADDLTLVYDFQRDAEDGLPMHLGLSCLEYDPVSDRIYALTTFETSDQQQGGVGGFLWFLPLPDLFERRSPFLVHDRDGNPLQINHKCEALTLLDENTLFVINDDDRIVGEKDAQAIDARRLPHQTSYSIVTLQGSSGPSSNESEVETGR